MVPREQALALSLIINEIGPCRGCGIAEIMHRSR
jgi:hypothetical protein